MLNETLNQTIGKTTKITFEEWTAITQDPKFIIAMLIIWLVPIILYIIVGALVKGGGKHFSKKMIEYSNFWYAPLIWFFGQAGLILIFIIFPLFLKWF